MMRLPSFSYRAPRALAEAAAMLAESPESTRLVAGGTDLWPNMKRRHQSAETVVSLARVPGLRGRNGDGTDETRIGAMTTLSEIEHDHALRAAYPGFIEAVASISAPVLRNMGTIGGNLCLDTRCTYYNQSEEWRRSIGYCMKEVGDTCWVAPGSPRCWAISATDAAPLLCAIGARVRLVSGLGERVIDLADLYADDGISYLTKRRDEILVDLLLPPARGLRSTYQKLRRRGSIDFPVLGVGAAVRLDAQGIVESARIYLGAVRSSPTRVEEAESVLVGRPLDGSSIAEAARLAKKPAAPLDNTDFVVSWRKTMIENYVVKALRTLAR